jgi:2,3,4,5-tetrahydropyridine-2-carboxylate N-succinyltransferase
VTPDELRIEIEALSAEGRPDAGRSRRAVDCLLDALEEGRARAASPGEGGWQVHEWVKKGILLAFRCGEDRPMDLEPVFHFKDREMLPTWDGGAARSSVRIVPGGTTVRRGTHLGAGVVVMPPAYVNVGAFVGAESMIDSHVLVGSCAQIGSGVHLSAGVQIGGVLEPIGSAPVIVEDSAFIGGGCGLFEGTRIETGAVLAPGVVLTRSVPLYDLVRASVHRAGDDGVLVVPSGAVVVPGSRPAKGEFARERGVQLQTPVVVKYRDRATEASVALEQALR